MLPFDVDGEESLHFSGAPTHSGSKGFPLAVAEEKHLEHMGVVDWHTTSSNLPVAILRSQKKNVPSILLSAIHISGNIIWCINMK